MMIDIPEAAAKEEKLLQVTNALELLKDVVGFIIEEMEEDEKDKDSLEEAMDAMDDAINAIGVAIDELEEEELELDEEFDDDDEPGVSDGLHIGIVIGKG